MEQELIIMCLDGIAAKLNKIEITYDDECEEKIRLEIMKILKLFNNTKEIKDKESKCIKYLCKCLNFSIRMYVQTVDLCASSNCDSDFKFHVYIIRQLLSNVLFNEAHSRNMELEKWKKYKANNYIDNREVYYSKLEKYIYDNLNPYNI